MVSQLLKYLRSAVAKPLVSSFLAIILLFFASSAGYAEVKINLRDKHLENECDWAMYLDVQQVQKFNTENSTLRPLSKVRVTYRAFPRADKSQQNSEAETIQEYWYKGRVPIGSRRYSNPKFPLEGLGIIVLGSIDRKNGQPEAITNVLLRLMIDLQFKNIPTSIIWVPEKNFDDVASALTYYNFCTESSLSTGKRISIHLASRDSAREQIMFWGQQ